MMLRSYQKEAVEKLKSGKILCGGVGTGKTLTALAYYFTKICNGKIMDTGDVVLPSSSVPLIVITTARKRDSLDWEKEASSFGINDILVDSWNNVHKYVKNSNCFFIFDEQRVVGHGKWVKSFLKIAKNNQWILLSATPGDTWMDYIPVFIANGFYKTFSEFKDRHVIYKPYSKFPKIEGYKGTAALERLKHNILVTMEAPKVTERHIETIIVDYDKNFYNSTMELRGYIGEDNAYHPFKTLQEMAVYLRKIANSDNSRIGALNMIFLRHPKLIIFYNYDFELGILQDWAERIGLTYSQWNGHKHEPIPEGKEWAYFVQYSAGAEAWNCIETDTIVFYSLNYSYKIMEQSRGRIDRMNTPFYDLYYYELVSKAPIDKAIKKAILSKRLFNENNFLREKNMP